MASRIRGAPDVGTIPEDPEGTSGAAARTLGMHHFLYVRPGAFGQGDPAGFAEILRPIWHSGRRHARCLRFSGARTAGGSERTVLKTFHQQLPGPGGPDYPGGPGREDRGHFARTLEVHPLRRGPVGLDGTG